LRKEGRIPWAGFDRFMGSVNYPSLYSVQRGPAGKINTKKSGRIIYLFVVIISIIHIGIIQISELLYDLQKDRR